MKIIFYGTPEFAVHSLKALVNNSFEILAVVTAPDKPSGRGLTLNESAIKKYAVSKNLKVLQPTNLKDDDFISEIKDLDPEIQVVVAFRMMPQKLWSLPKFGTFNLHASLLPNYRGAAPINWAIINGEDISGVTTFFLKHEIDTGDIILQKSITIGENETAGELHDKLMIHGAELIISTMTLIKNGDFKTLSQDSVTSVNDVVKSAPKLNNENCHIDWSKDDSNVHNLVRGLSPYPSAFTYLNDGTERLKKFKIIRSRISERTTNQAPGTILIEQGNMYVACGNRLLELLEVQLEGKKKMKVSEFVKGFRLTQEMHF